MKMEELYNELGTDDWSNGGEWDEAIEAVRMRIRKAIDDTLQEESNAFDLDDKEIQNLYDELQKSITKEHKRYTIGSGVLDVHWSEPIMDKMVDVPCQQCGNPVSVTEGSHFGIICPDCVTSNRSNFYG